MGTMNDKRADWADTALQQFKLETGQDDDVEALGDLMCNLCHLATQHGLDPEAVIFKAFDMYAAEVTDDE